MLCLAVCLHALVTGLLLFFKCHVYEITDFSSLFMQKRQFLGHVYYSMILDTIFGTLKNQNNISFKSNFYVFI